jgi:two-component system LytT family response regulator
MNHRPLRVLVADDELMARRRVLRLLADLPDVVVVGECQDGAEVLAFLEDDAVDLVLLDVQMPRMTGTEALRALGDDGPTVIFTTAHPEHAVAAFDGGATDYLLKPIEAERLGKALDRARARRPRADAPRTDRLAVPTRKGVVLIKPDELVRAVLDGESLVLVTDRGSFFTDWRLSDLEARLPEDRFARVHRRALVQLDRVDRFEPLDSGGYFAWFADGTSVEVSRQVARRLRRDWGL